MGGRLSSRRPPDLLFVKLPVLKDHTRPIMVIGWRLDRVQTLLTLKYLQHKFPTINIGQIVNISTRYNAIYVANPKSGCSSVKTILFKAHQDYGETDPDRIHRDRVLPLPSQIGWPNVMTMLSSGSAFRFTFVRDPVDRLVSAYNDKIIGRHAPLYAGQVASWLGKKEGTGANISFEEFVAFVASHPAMELDQHWRPQYINIMHDVIDYDFIGRVETFDRDMATVGRLTGMPIVPGVIMNAQPKRFQLSERPDLLKKIFDIYAEDYARFA